MKMRVQYFIIIALLSVIAACGGKPKETAETTSAGETTTTTTSQENANVSSDVSQSSEDKSVDLRDTITPGSEKDFLVNVGDRVFFDFDSSAIGEKSQETLKAQAAWLKAYPALNVIIEGHADERGTREYNLALGERRAESVKKYLVALGLSSVRIQTVSFGKERPAVAGSNENAWRQNRRGVTVVSAD